MRRFFAISLIASAGLLAAPREKFRVQVDWHRFQINFKGTIPISEETSLNERNLLRDYAKEELLRAVSRYLENFQVTSDMRVDTILAQNPNFAREYSLFLETLELGSLFLRQGRIETSMTIPLRGRNGLLARTPLHWSTEKYQMLQPSEYVGEGYLKKNVTGEYQPSLAPVRYTGLIIDATDLKVKTALAPRVYSQNGKLLYGSEFLVQRAGTRRGIVSYASALSDPQVLLRAGKHPLLTVAIAAQGKYQSNLVIAQEDTVRLFDHPETVQNLLKCKVVILVKE